ncbi:MAG: ATP synthase F1 subunit gamma [Bacteroidetes bacterium GWF2_38_335]|nr:MAG: ATP synthase F1 subunit gamma [Bacteroidetes bacterium GWF2_38_335]OFY81305.1 MAG: ATP synthase F1 subunit gamma [Bacteroidetes bacterium RIFOXYA12_FULL_38_20]HBS85425.1 ATP synthase F1 subunit gamma [Bacteroidales bacterium]
MASLKEIRTRITSVNSTKQITSAMKMVSAAKLRKAQDAIVRMRPYAIKLHEILGNLSNATDSALDNPYAVQREAKNILIVAITSNKGLCGAFNANVIKKAQSIAAEKYSDLLAKGKVSFLTLGKKSYDGLKGKGLNLIQGNNAIFDKLTFERTTPLAEELMNDFTTGKFDTIILVYNEFKNAAVQILTEEQFLPVQINTGKSKIVNDYIFEPTKDYIMKELIPKSLKIQFYKALLDSNAAEHGARMTAMHKATDNATELIKELRLHYNKARQASITNEILEIVSGAEALKG